MPQPNEHGVFDIGDCIPIEFHLKNQKLKLCIWLVKNHDNKLWYTAMFAQAPNDSHRSLPSLNEDGWDTDYDAVCNASEQAVQWFLDVDGLTENQKSKTAKLIRSQAEEWITNMQEQEVPADESKPIEDDPEINPDSIDKAIDETIRIGNEAAKAGAKALADSIQNIKNHLEPKLQRTFVGERQKIRSIKLGGGTKITYTTQTNERADKHVFESKDFPSNSFIDAFRNLFPIARAVTEIKDIAVSEVGFSYSGEGELNCIALTCLQRLDKPFSATSVDIKISNIHVSSLIEHSRVFVDLRIREVTTFEEDLCNLIDEAKSFLAGNRRKIQLLFDEGLLMGCDEDDLPDSNETEPEPENNEPAQIKHVWICDECGCRIPFRQPEIEDDDDPRSEVNADQRCVCGADMYFDIANLGGNQNQ